MPGYPFTSYTPRFVENLLRGYERQIETNSVISYAKYANNSLKLFSDIDDIIRWTVNFMLTPLGGANKTERKYQVFRILNKVLRFLSNMKAGNVYPIRKYEHVIERIRDLIKGTLKKIEKRIYPFHKLVANFKSVNCVYSYSHDAIYSQIGHRLCILLDLLEDDSNDLSLWVPKGSLYMYTTWMGLNLLTKHVVVITREEIGLISFDLAYDEHNEFKRLAFEEEVVGHMDLLNWSLEADTDWFLCPATYVMSACDDMPHLLKVAKIFQEKVEGLQVIESLNVEYIFLMCNVLLTRAKDHNRVENIGFFNEIMSRVFSVLNYILPAVIRCKSDEKTVIQMSRECTYIMKLCRFFRGTVYARHVGKYNSFVDIMYKYLVVYIKPEKPEFPDWDFFFVKKLSSVAIHRIFRPEHITVNNYDFWKPRFLVHHGPPSALNDELNQMCVVCCEIHTDVYSEDFAVMENCDHICCTKCLLEAINPATSKPCIDLPLINFTCPKTNCKIKTKRFTTGLQLKKYRDYLLQKTSGSEYEKDAEVSELTAEEDSNVAPVFAFSMATDEGIESGQATASVATEDESGSGVNSGKGVLTKKFETGKVFPTDGKTAEPEAKEAAAVPAVVADEESDAGQAAPVPDVVADEESDAGQAAPVPDVVADEESGAGQTASVPAVVAGEESDAGQAASVPAGVAGEESDAGQAAAADDKSEPRIPVIRITPSDDEHDGLEPPNITVTAPSSSDESKGGLSVEPAVSGTDYGESKAKVPLVDITAPSSDEEVLSE